MTNRKPSTSPAAPYDIGYGKPPAATRFQKGKSGNPQGRPKRQPRAVSEHGTQTFADLFLQLIEQPVTIREGVQTREIAGIEAVSKALLKAAVGGNNRAQRQIVELYDAAVADQNAKIARRNEIAQIYISSCRAETLDCERRKMPPPRHIPHPDDIVIREGQDLQFIGPVTEEQADSVDRLHRGAKAVMLHWFWEEERLPIDPETGRQPLSVAGISFAWINAILPPRLRIASEEVVRELARFDRLRARDKRARIIEAWQAAIPGARPCLTPSLRAAAILASAGMDLRKLAEGTQYTDFSTTS